MIEEGKRELFFLLHFACTLFSHLPHCSLSGLCVLHALILCGFIDVKVESVLKEVKRYGKKCLLGQNRNGG